MLPSYPGDIILNKKVRRDDFVSVRVHQVFGYVHALLEIIEKVYDLCYNPPAGGVKVNWL